MKLIAAFFLVTLAAFTIGWLDRTNREAWAACQRLNSDATCQHVLQSAKPTN